MMLLPSAAIGDGMFARSEGKLAIDVLDVARRAAGAARRESLWMDNSLNQQARRDKLEAAYLTYTT
jgi:hypothetical protein